MLKKTIAWVLALALTFSVMPQISVGVTAEGEVQIPEAHSHSATQHDCEHCDETVTWDAWGDAEEEKTSLPVTGGHYYLVSDIKPAAQTKLTGTTDVVLCLNGYSIDSEALSATTLYVQDSAKLTISDCTAYTDAEGVFHAGAIKNGEGWGAMSGAIYAKNNCAVAIYNCIFTANVLKKNDNSDISKGGAVQLRGDKAGAAPTLHLENVLFDSNTSGASAGAVCIAGSTTTPVVTVKDCVFTNNTALDGSAIFAKNADMTITGCRFENNIAQGGKLVVTRSGKSTEIASLGGTVYSYGGVLKMKECTFEGNEAAAGGAVYIDSTTTAAEIEKCTFENNTATGASGGNIRLNKATVTMDKCTMTDNIGKNSGGSAIHAGGGNCQVTLNDCVITGNKSTGTGNTYRGGVYMTNASDKLTVSGATVIDNNIVAADGTPIERNIFIQNPVNPVDVGGLTKGASVSIHTRNADATEATMVKADTAPTEWNRNWVIYENNGKAIEYGTTEGFYFADIIGHEHCVCGVSTCTDATHTKIDFLEWEYTDSLPTSGNYYLKSDVVLDGEVVITENLTLCLNGHSVTQSKSANRVISVTAGQLQITSCANGGKITGGNANGGAGVLATGEGTALQMFNVTVSGNTSGNVGGGISVTAKAQATLTNVTVSGNTSGTNGGGISVRDGGKLTMTGGSVSENNSGKDGGGLYGQAGTEVTVTDASFISNAVASGAGGGIAISGVATLNNLTIQNNRSAGSAGGLIVQGSGVVTMNGGIVTGNAGTTGAGIYALKQLTLNGVTVTGNTASKLGGGIYLATDGVLTLTGDTIVKGNTADNLYMKSGCNAIFDQLTDDAYISVSVLDNAPRAISKTLTQDPTAYIYSDSADLQVAYRDNVVYLDAAIKHTHCLCGGEGTGCDHAAVNYAKWDKTDSLPTEGAYFLDCDVQLTAEVSISGDLQLCLNGHTVKAAEGKRVMSNPKDTVATVSISDCTASTDADGNYTAGKLTGGVDKGGNAGGGFMYVRAGGALKLYDGIITECTSIYQGGAVCLAEGTTMEMHGGEISNCTAVTADGATWKKGGAVSVYKAQFTMTGGTIKNNKATNGAISANSNSTVTISGGTICGNWSKADGGGVYVNAAGLYISGNAVICHNTSDAAGGNICYGGNSFGSVTDAIIEGGNAGAGAGAMVQNGAVVEFTNVTLKDNTASNLGGAIRLYKATLTLNDCTITGNTAKTAGAIAADTSANLTIKNGKITENTATSANGGVQVDATSSLTLEGKPEIANNTQSNLLLQGGTLMDVSALTEGACIWISADMGPISKACEDVSACFISESAYRSVVYRDGTLYMATDGSHKHCDCVGTNATCDHAAEEWAAWESTTSLPTSGKYYLLNDVVLTAEQSISSSVSICLNGHTVTAAENKRHISTVKDTPAHIVITDCTAKTEKGVYTAGKLTGGVDTSDNVGGGSIYIRAGGTLELYQGIITGNTSYKAGGAMLFQTGVKFVMYGGEISNNTAYLPSGETWQDGGAIYSLADSDIQILGGTIANNEGNRGGAIYCYCGSLTIAGGTITGNTSHGQGGGIYSVTGIVTISGGKITGNTSLSTAGGLCLATNSQATMTGGEISNNTATGCGGVAVQGGSTMQLTDGLITKNSVTGMGAGVGLYSKAVLTMTGGKITKNTSEKNAGGIYNNAAFLVMQGGSISNNTAGKDGAGIYVNAGGNLDISGEALISGNKLTAGSGGGISFGSNSTGKISGGTIEKNTVANGGGGAMIIQNGASVEITDVNIQNNTAKKSGGGIWIYKATLKMSGGTIQNNKSSTATGGGISATSESVLTVTGGTVKNNTAKTTGGGISSNKCTTNLSGVTVTGNSCERDGAGIYNTAGLMNINGNVVSAYNTTKGNGGGVCYGSKSYGYISGISIYGNTANAGGGGMIIQNNADVTIGYAYISGNTAKKTSGGIYLYKASLTMTGGYIGDNVAGTSGGGIYATDAGKLELSNVTITKNSGKSGGGLYLLRSKATVKDSEISYNTTTSSGTGVYVSGGTWKAAMAGGDFTNVKFIGNHGGSSCSGAAMYINGDVEVSFTGCEIANNISENYGGGIYAAAGAVPTMNDCTFTGNEAVRNGGALLVRDCGVLNNCVFSGNKADKGAAIFAGNYMELYHVNGFGSKGDDIGLFMTNCTITDNEAVTDGAGLHLDMSCYTTIDNCIFTGNKAGAFGSAMWLWENCTMTNLTVTGNTCGENGHAVYLADSEHDGQTYINGLFKMGGDMIIKDNQGGDLFLANKVTIGALKGGYGEKTHMGVTLDAGLLTQRVMGVYDYEGGNLSYILTYGDRSMTDPEYQATANQEQTPDADETQNNETTGVSDGEASTEDNTILYAGIGGIAAIIVLAAILVIVKKKKSAKAEKN